MKKKQKLEEWSKMTIKEKLKYNGFNGFLNDELYVDTSLFKNKRRRG